MPVIEKIGTIVSGYSIGDEETWIICDGKTEISIVEADTVIERTFLAVIEFIIWYNGKINN